MPNRPAYYKFRCTACGKVEERYSNIRKSRCCHAPVIKVLKHKKDILSVLQDPAAVELNIMRGIIKLPDYYIRKTDTSGEFASLVNEKATLQRQLDFCNIMQTYLSEVIDRYIKLLDHEQVFARERAELLLEIGDFIRWVPVSESMPPEDLHIEIAIYSGPESTTVSHGALHSNRDGTKYWSDFFFNRELGFSLVTHWKYLYPTPEIIAAFVARIGGLT